MKMIAPAATLAAALALAVSGPAIAATPNAQPAQLGPWQMMGTGSKDDLPGTASAFLLNTETGALFICVFAPATGRDTRGCLPMLQLGEPTPTH